MDRRSMIKTVAVGGVAALATHDSVTAAAPSCPPQSGADVVLSGTLDYPTGFTVPAGEVWEFDPTTDTTVRSGGNIVVNGTLRATPGPRHRVVFYGINNANYVGGGEVVLESDVGIWVVGDGQLDIVGVHREAWNRTGSHPSWQPGDELRVMSMGPASMTGHRIEPALYDGGPLAMVTSPDGLHTFTAEVVNLTRSFTVESEGDGRAHIMFLHCSRPQRFEYVEVKHLGPANVAGR